MKSLLILSDSIGYRTNRDNNRLLQYCQEGNVQAELLSYTDFFKKKPFSPKSEKLNVMFWFPIDFWNEHCEVPEDTGVYGTSKKAYNRFKDFWSRVKERVEMQFPDRKISYIIPPDIAFIDRDKIETHRLLTESKVPTTTMLSKDLEAVLQKAEEAGVFIKCRYGACGKGITYISPGKWVTNYVIGEKNTIQNFSPDEQWEFSDITGNKDFLKRLLDLEVIAEQEITPPELSKKDHKFDIRSYVVFGEVPHMFLRENNVKSIITNFNQGGTVHHEYTKYLPQQPIELVKQISLDSVKTFPSQILGVDVMFDGDLQTPKILEIQSFPGLPDFRYFNLLKFLVTKLD